MIGKTISHYQILEKLGGGGMGVVYKAKDTKLDRFVALKFLPPHLSVDEEAKQRFIAEAKAASALDHPNIAVIHEIGETEEGELFIAMAFYDGETLKEKVNSGQLSVNSAIDFAIQIAQGLARAHEAGITHRDIKPANIMVTNRGEVKIVDFGLAKMAHVDLTKPGSTLGTAAYMSPEQARGESVDHRTDIWAFGVVLYEMLTGQLPFRGVYEAAVMYSILNEEPAPISELRDDVPESLQQIITKALAKDVGQRFQSMNDLRHSLQQISTKSPTDAIAAPKQEKSIVVLPFENISPDPENAYFSDGLTEEIIADLSKISALRVISRTSAMRLKGTEKDVKTIGRELQVQFVLEGSVRKAGNNLRITAQLIDTRTDAHLWAEKYGGTLDDVFEIQENVSRSIVAALKLKLAPEEDKKLAEHPIADARAYDYYFRARQEILKMTASGLKKAFELIDLSRKIVGDNVLLLSAEGYIHWQYYNSGVESDEKHLDETERCAQRIFQLEPESIHAYRLIGLAQLHRKNGREGIRNLKKVLEFDQDDIDALLWLAIVPALTGKTAEARVYGDRLVKIDPLTPYNYTILSQAPYYEGEFAEAEAAVKKAMELDPENPVWKACYLLVVSTIWTKEHVAAFYEKSLKECEESFITNLAFFHTCALKGDKASAQEVLTEEFVIATRNDLQASVFVADGLALLNQKKEAIDWLENAVTRGFTNYPFLSKHDPFLRSLDGEKEFQQLLVKVKKEWELVMESE